jgi:RNA-directed DNA polymerase
MEAVVERENLWLALKQVERNKGAAGVADMTVGQLRAYLREHWLRIREELLAGTYQPQPVRKVEIPKPGGKGMRMLGIPTVIDRLIQSALHQVLSHSLNRAFGIERAVGDQLNVVQTDKPERPLVEALQVR